MPVYFIYLIYTSALATLMFILIPRKVIHRLALFGVFYGAVIDIFWIVFISLLDVGGYINYGPLHFLNIPFLPPVSWTVFFIMYLYLLPDHSPWNYMFAVAAAGYSVFFSNVLAHLGIFQWTLSKFIFPLWLYMTWFLFTTWSYQKYGQKLLRSGFPNRIDKSER